ncbi:hypothetical protein Dimus_014078 [Dionaea muscipula]
MEICKAVGINSACHQIEVFHRCFINDGVKGNYILVPISDDDDVSNLMDIAESMGMNWMHELYISHSLIQPSGVSTKVRDDVHQFQGILTAHIDPSHEDSEVERILEESNDDPYEEEVENDELPHPSQNIVNELPKIDDLPDDSGPSHYGQAHTRDGAGFDDVSFYHVRGGDGRVCFEDDQ